MSINKIYIGILSIAITVLLSACSSDDSGTQEVTAGKNSIVEKMQVMVFSSPFSDAVRTDPSNPSGFNPYTPDKTINMSIYMLLPENWVSPQVEKIIYINKWHAYFDVDANKTYTVYGYVPKIGEMASSVEKSIADAATLTISNIKPITTDDICIITGVKDTQEGLKEGQFGWRIENANDNFYMYLLMDHLYAAAQFCLSIDEEYAQLRTISLKKMTLGTDKGSVNATIALTHNTTGTSPITSVTYTLSGSSDAVEIFNSNMGTELNTTTPLVINAYFAPTLSGNLTLDTIYDVYDSKGNLIRENCSATNKIPDLEASRGQRVQINMSVNPSYIYVLSDADLDNPTIELKKE